MQTDSRQAHGGDTHKLPRNDIYGPVHKGIRWALCSLLVRMGAADLTDRARLPLLLDDLDGALYLCALHLDHEERHIHPAIEKKRPGLTAKLSADHREHEGAIAELRGLAESLEAAAPEQTAPIARTLYLRFSAFVAHNLHHMLEEETVLESLLEELYTDDELRALQETLLRSVGPDEMLAFARVMVPANRIDVGVAMLKGARTSMPPEAFASLVRSFRPNLDEAGWRELTRRLDLAGDVPSPVEKRPASPIRPATSVEAGATPIRRNPTAKRAPT